MVSRTVTQLYDGVLRPSGLRVTQFSILATIARLGETNLRQLECMRAIDQATLTTGASKPVKLTSEGETSPGDRAAALGQRSRR